MFKLAAFNMFWDELENLEDKEEELEEATVAWVASMLTGVLMICEAQNEQHCEHQLYLCWGELLPDPRIAMPWQRLWESQQD